MATDFKLTQLSDITQAQLSLDDILYVVNDPAGTPGSRFATFTEVASLLTVPASGRSFLPDNPPASANAMDDEFRAGSLDAKWTIVDQQAGQTVTVAQDYLTLVSPSTVQRRIFGVTQAAPAGNWKVRAKVTIEAASSNYFGVGLIARRGTKGIHGLIAYYSTFGALTAVMVRTSDVNTFSSETDLYEFRHQEFYMELEYDGTNLVWRISVSGADASYVRFYSEAVATFLGGAADAIGIAMHPYGDSVANMGLVMSSDWFRRIS